MSRALCHGCQYVVNAHSLRQFIHSAVLILYAEVREAYHQANKTREMHVQIFLNFLSENKKLNSRKK